MDYQAVLDFWFDELVPEQHFKKDAKIDARIRERFLDMHTAAKQGELFTWRKSAQGRLAEIIVLDQFSRNLFREDPRAFATDGVALVLAQEAVRVGADAALPAEQRAFLYMPWMHSESLTIHKVALELFAQPGLESNLKFERKHFDILKRFDRYPHRNAVLGRMSTAEEKAFISEHPGF